MNKDAALFICLAIGLSEVSLAHGPGGGGQSFEAKAPKIKYDSVDPFSQLPVSKPGFGITMSIESQPIKRNVHLFLL